VSDEQNNTAGGAEFAAAMAAPNCPVCSRPKRVGLPFCQTCWYAVPIWARNWMSSSSDLARACETFRIWSEHLVKWADRITRTGWDFHSWKEIEAAGYKMLNVSRCRAIGCGARIGWVEDAAGRLTPLNVEGEYQFQPHRTSCKNPGVYREKKSVQASARRRRGR
jgi:hypothetical protein